MEWATTDSLKETPFFFVEVMVEASSSVDELSSEELELLRTNPGRVEVTSSSLSRRRAKPSSQEPPPRCFSVETFSLLGLLLL
jgi:hypothetical protein